MKMNALKVYLKGKISYFQSLRKNLKFYVLAFSFVVILILILRGQVQNFWWDRVFTASTVHIRRQGETDGNY